ncbi:trehalase family glycosidase [uncultured Winogradskyella sp.]|uniref:trehalase family glycosidase n=1 Tax=uncultured Winogradskyella sp. TaxID=395353 RepID=UPI002636DEE5|nr:trehalase family glycosidase [uncultured Winogradskyella sp.]
MEYNYRILIVLGLLMLSCKNDSEKMSAEGISFKVDIEQTLAQLLKQEDTDGDKKITIEDKSSKVFELKSNSGETLKIEGTYKLSNLLQELVLVKNKGETIGTIKTKYIDEKPVDRTSRLIKNYYWDGLTRHLDKDGIENLIKDTKNKSLVSEELRIYVPYQDSVAFNYYQKLETSLPITTIKLPESITPAYVKSINNQPGILSLKLDNNNGKLQGVPFVVPGGRFNEMYGWDSYFESIGLIVDGRVDLAKAMADNFQYQIDNYGKILNANRSYYLTRTQPPYYSSLVRAVFEKTEDLKWLSKHLETAIKEYETVWMVSEKRLTFNGLNRYFSDGIGIPPETEEGHFNHALSKYAKGQNMTIAEFTEQYQSGKLKLPEVDMFFTHDRSMRESGHDTSYRLDGKTANLNIIDVNALLYKYEIDFADLIAQNFKGSFKSSNGKEYTSDYWKKKAENRKNRVDELLWNEEKGLYLDYNIVTKQQETFVAATTFMPMWANMADKEQAKQLVERTLPLLKEKGGIVASTQESLGDISEGGPARQWDYPSGWAPHQMMIWKGLINYGYNEEAQELIYRWLYMITKNAVDYNGTIPEKYDVVAATHKVFAEYGNVGTDFEYITQEGFGWMNASYQYGLTLLESNLLDNLNQLKAPELIFNSQ